MAAHASRIGLPSASTVSLYAQEGGLIGFGPDPLDLFRRAAIYVDKIFKGAKPADLPVEQPLKLEMVVNRTTARALGIMLPQPVLLSADRVID